MVSAPMLAENKPWVISADALHYSRPDSRERSDTVLPITFCFPGMPQLLRNAKSAEILVSDLKKKNNTDDQDRSFEKSVETDAPSPIFTEATKNPGKKVKNYIHIQAHKSVCCGTIQNFSKHPNLLGYES